MTITKHMSILKMCIKIRKLTQFLSRIVNNRSPLRENFKSPNWISQLTKWYQSCPHVQKKIKRDKRMLEIRSVRSDICVCNIKPASLSSRFGVGTGLVGLFREPPPRKTLVEINHALMCARRIMIGHPALSSGLAGVSQSAAAVRRVHLPVALLGSTSAAVRVRQTASVSLHHINAGNIVQRTERINFFLDCTFHGLVLKV